ncbi:MAG: adenylate/guanylate cyclase domain-containing protein [Methanobacteriota archaeon]|nr:MAG: adenylate/guanylate cyclase domain-containing protein [Euryarchaeota archaeon]
MKRYLSIAQLCQSMVEVKAIEFILALSLYIGIKFLSAFHNTQKVRELLAGLVSLFVFFNLWLYTYSGILGSFFSMFSIALNAAPVIGIGALYYIDSKKRKALNYFSKYVDEKVVKELMKKDISVGGERREATIVFTDVRGFTAMSEKLRAEDIVEILNGHFDIIADVCHKKGGTLLKFIGDAAMVAFNIPLKQEEHEKLAIETCKEIIELMKSYSKEVKKKYGVEFKIGIGVASGELVVGNIGSERQMDYTVIGDVVNTAARLNGVAKGWEIAVLAKTAKKAEINGEVEKAGVKGKKKEVEFVRLRV